MKRKYTLFEKIDGKWVRLSPFSYYKQSAIRVYQGKMIHLALEGRLVELRVVNEN